MVFTSTTAATANGSSILPPSLPVVVDDARKTMFLLHHSHHKSIHFLMLLAALLARHTPDKSVDRKYHYLQPRAYSVALVSTTSCPNAHHNTCGGSLLVRSILWGFF